MAECVAGCACEEVRLDGHNPERNSQMFLEAFKVTQADECFIAVTVTDVSNRLAPRHLCTIAPLPGPRPPLATWMCHVAADRNSFGLLANGMLCQHRH